MSSEKGYKEDAGQSDQAETNIPAGRLTEVTVETQAQRKAHDAAERKAKATEILMAMLTAGLLLIGGLQWYEAHTSGADTKHLSESTAALAAAANSQLHISDQERNNSETQLRIIKDSAISAQELAKRTGDEVKKMEEANRIHQAEMTSVQRAFITVDELRRTPIAEEPETYRYAPVIINTGNTPAMVEEMMSITPRNSWTIFRPGTDYEEARLRARHGVPPDPLQTINIIKKYTNPLNRPILNNFEVGAKENIDPGYEFHDDEFGIEDLNTDKTLHLEHFIYGYIKYRDGFGVEHEKMYCFHVGATERTNNEKVRLIRPVRCKYWNCEDAQCVADRKRYEVDIAALWEEERRNPDEGEPPPKCEHELGEPITLLDIAACEHGVLKNNSEIAPK